MDNRYKKLQYLTDALITPFIKSNHPKWSQLIRAYLEFLDENAINRVLNILDNINSNTIYSELLDDYLDQMLRDVIDLDRYGLDEDNKKLFVGLAEFIHNMKGNRKAFNFLFNSFTNFTIPTTSGDIGIDKVAIDLIEDEDWWIPGIFRFYNAEIDYDGTSIYEFDAGRPFTYIFKVDQPEPTIIDLIRKVHPAGFLRLFLIEVHFSDEVQVTDEADLLTTTTTYEHYYNANYDYDGEFESPATVIHPFTYDGQTVVEENF